MLHKRTTIVWLVLAMVIAACSSATDASTTTTASGSVSAATTTAGSADETTTTASAASATTTAAPATGSLASCVVGRWILDPVAFFENVFASQDQEGLDGEFVFVSGEYELIIADDGSFEALRDDWSFAITSDLGSMEVVVNDSDVGSWTLDGDVLSTKIVPGDPPEIEILIDGVPFEFPAGVAPLEPPEAEFTGATVACDGDLLSATAEGFTSVWTRS